MGPLRIDSVPRNVQERFTHCKETRAFTPNSIQTMVQHPKK